MAILPKIKLKALVSFPSSVIDGAGVDVTRINGAFKLDLAFDDFAPPVAGVSDAAHQNALLWNSATGAYVLAPITILGSGGAVPEAPNNGIQYARQSLNWTPVTGGTTVLPSSATPVMDGIGTSGASALYSRGDHVHPTDTTRAPLASPVFTGDPQAPTPVPSNNTSIATTAYVATEISAKQATDADLTAIAGLSGTGIARRTATTPTWSVGTAVSNAELAAMAAFSFKGNNTSVSATPTDIDIAALTSKTSPGGGDFVLLSDQAASGLWKKLPVANFPGASGGIVEAPNDGLQYGRQSLGWTQITGGGASPSTAFPLMDGTATAGSHTLYSRDDHVHPSDTTRQPVDAELTAIAGLTSAADRAPYFTGSGTAALATLTTYGRSLIDDADAATARTTLGLTAAATSTPAALSRVNDTNVTLTLTGTPATALLQATTVTAGWSGTLGTARGGFGTDISASSGVPLFAGGAPTFTGTTGTGNFVRAANPALTGNPTAPTPTARDSSTSIATTAFVTTGTREKVTADRIYYVRVDGSDSNNGLLDTAGGAFLTIQKAWDTIAALDMSIYDAYIALSSGTTYTTGLVTTSFPVGGLRILLYGQGAGATISTSTDCILNQGRGTIYVTGITLVSSAGWALHALGRGAKIYIETGTVFGACGAGHIRCEAGAHINGENSYTITGSAPLHYQLTNQGMIECAAITITLTGTLAFTIFADCEVDSVISMYTVTFSGAATGQRYTIGSNAVINTFGGGANFFPGNAAGVATSGGVYL